LGIEGFSSSRLGPDELMLSGGTRGLITDAPSQVWAQSDSDSEGQRLMSGHNGYAPTHGLTHIRQLSLSIDGRSLTGEDTLGAMTGGDRRRFETIMERTKHQGVEFHIRFHLHPDVDAKVDLGGTAISMALKSGEMWIFRHNGIAEMSLENSVYLETGRLKPRASKQIVLTSLVLDYARQVGWTLAKAQDTPAAIRDTEREEDFAAS
jgi:uncharacterized heparinase superfamily protein